ncbi:MAG: hypothetical protein ACI88A_001770 [Paraglaciecola sp.]|jgi:hypothetical protein
MHGGGNTVNWFDQIARLIKESKAAGWAEQKGDLVCWACQSGFLNRNDGPSNAANNQVNLSLFCST